MDGMNINNISHNLIHTWTPRVHVTEHEMFFSCLSKRSIRDISLTAAYFLFVVPWGLFVALAVSRRGVCHILYCHRHSLMLLYLPMPIHCAVMPNALLSYVSPRLSAAQKGCFALHCMVWHDQAQGLSERDAAVQSTENVHISSSCSELLLANKLARLPFLSIYCYFYTQYSVYCRTVQEKQASVVPERDLYSDQQ